MIRIDRMYPGVYGGSCAPPTADRDYRCPDLLSRADLTVEFLKRGVSAERIDAAFAEADEWADRIEGVGRTPI